MASCGCDYDAKRARAKRPVPVWADAFLRDTTHLAADEVGGYHLILYAMWARPSCDLPHDDHQLARICRVSLKLWRSRVGPNLLPFFHATEGGALASKRLRQEAEYVEKNCQDQHDRKCPSKGKGTYTFPEGAQQVVHFDGEKSRNHLENNDTALTADAPRIEPPIHPTQLPNYPTEEDLPAAAAPSVPRDAAQPQDPDYRERILTACGVRDVVSGITGPDGRMLGRAADMAIADRWLKPAPAGFGLTVDQVVAVIAERVAKMRSPPGSFSYFEGAMADFANARDRPIPIGTPAAPRPDPTVDRWNRLAAPGARK